MKLFFHHRGTIACVFALCLLSGNAQARPDYVAVQNDIAAPALLRAPSSAHAVTSRASAANPSVPASTRANSLRDRAIDIDFSQLAFVQAALSAGAGPQLLRLPFFDDTSLLVEISAVNNTSSGGYAYTGRVSGLPASAVVLVDNGGAVSFNVATLSSTFVVHGSAVLGYVASELGAVDRPDHPAAPPAITDAASATAGSNSGAAVSLKKATAATAGVLTDSGASIDVMVVYTPAALAANGGTDLMNANIDAQVALTNSIYQNSGVTQRLRLVHTGLVAYSETDMNTDLPRLRAVGDGYLDDVPTLRDLYGADVVSLWGVYSGSCGLGYVMATESTGFASSAYNVVASPACTGGNAYTFAHEMGHNMGLEHDPYISDTTATTVVTPEAGGAATTITYAHGFVDLGNRFRTIMAYNNQCLDTYGSDCPRIPYFSNPAAAYNNKAYYPLAVNAVMGNTTTSKEFQVLNDTRETVANFRTALSSFTGPGTLTFMPGATMYLGKSAGPLQVRVARHLGTTGAISVNYTTANGTAKSGVDYTATSGTLTWLAGDSSEKIITIPVIASATLAPARTFTITLSAATGGAVISSASTTGTVILLDDRQDTFPPTGAIPPGYSSPSSSTAWTVVSDTTAAGAYSLRSAKVYGTDSINFSTYANSDLQFTGTFVAGNFSFAYKISSYPNYGQADILVDGVVVANSTGGEVDWTTASLPITAGKHTIIWRFKNRLPFACNGATVTPAAPGGAACADRLWIDSVVLPLVQKPLSARGGIDLDGEGKAEILLRNNVPQLQSAKLGSNFRFQFAALTDPGAAFRVIGVGDFNGDGKSDLAIQNILADPQFGDVHIWPNFDPVGDAFIRSVKLPWQVQAVADFDGDGSTDLLFRFAGDDGIPGDAGVSYVWFLNSNGLSKVRKRGGAPLDWTMLGAADLNNDGAADLVYLSPAGALRALMATPDRTCANLSAGTITSGYTALKLADFSGNQRGDILLRNAVTGAVQLYQLDAAGLALPAYSGYPDDTNASCTSSPLVIPSTLRTLPSTDPTWTLWATGDLNGDGVADIVWLQADGTLTVWLMNANGQAPTIINNAGTAPSGYSVVQP